MLGSQLNRRKIYAWKQEIKIEMRQQVKMHRILDEISNKHELIVNAIKNLKLYKV